MSDYLEQNPEARETREYSEFAITIAKEAGDILLDRHGKIQNIEYKLKTDFKTETDDISDKFLRARISEKYPTHSIHSEELPPDIKLSEFSWVYDPLDGTLNFTNGVINLFSVSIGLCKGKEPVVGVVNAPKLGELYTAQKGEGAFLNGNRIHTSETADVNKAVVAMDFGKENRERGVPYFERLLARDGVTYPNVYACTSVSLAKVAAGKLDAYMSVGSDPWDYAGGVPVLREAGAKVTTIEGKDWELGDNTMLTANPKLHDKFLELFAQVNKKR